MNKLKNPISEIFKTEINPLLEQLMPEADNWASWQAFEGAFEHALYEIRKIILVTKGRDKGTLYGTKFIKPLLQSAREQTCEALIKHQATQFQLGKVKRFLQDIAQTDPEEEEARRQPEINSRISTWMRQVAPILDTIPRETKIEVFGENFNHESIWESLNTDPNHRNRVIEWLDALIMSELEGELKEMADIGNKFS
jgi:hypothetical protein